MVSSSEIDLSWTDNDNSNNVNGFKIERKTPGGTYTQVGIAGVNITSYQDTSLTCETTYYYRVLAYNGAGSSSYSTETSATTQACPTAPFNLQATAVSSSKIDLAWAENFYNVDGFKIERKTGSEGTYSVLDTTGSNVTLYSNTGLSSSTTYYYRVYAYNSSGNSGYSNEVNATTF